MKGSRIWLQNFHRTEETESLGGYRQSLVCTKTQEKATTDLQGAEPDWPGSVCKSPVQVWADSGLLQGQTHWPHYSWEAPCAGISLLVRLKYRKSTTPPISRKLDKWFTEHGPAYQNKTQFFPQPVPLIRKLPKASYPHPSEDRENENHSQRNLTKMIICITVLCNSMKLWAMPCRAIQDEWVKTESSDKMWSPGEGNGNPLQHSCFENPMKNMKRQKHMTQKILKMSVDVQYTTGEEQRNSSISNRAWAKSGIHNALLWIYLMVKVVWCCKKAMLQGTWDVSFMNQGKLEVVKQEIARVNQNFRNQWTKMDGNWQI